jgi:hypothetical protein
LGLNSTNQGWGGRKSDGIQPSSAVETSFSRSPIDGDSSWMKTSRSTDNLSSIQSDSLLIESGWNLNEKNQSDALRLSSQVGEDETGQVEGDERRPSMSRNTTHPLRSGGGGGGLFGGGASGRDKEYVRRIKKSFTDFSLKSLGSKHESTTSSVVTKGKSREDDDDDISRGTPSIIGGVPSIDFSLQEDEPSSVEEKFQVNTNHTPSDSISSSTGALAHYDQSNSSIDSKSPPRKLLSLGLAPGISKFSSVFSSSPQNNNSLSVDYGKNNEDEEEEEEEPKMTYRQLQRLSRVLLQVEEEMVTSGSFIRDPVPEESDEIRTDYTSTASRSEDGDRDSNFSNLEEEQARRVLGMIMDSNSVSHFSQDDDEDVVDPFMSKPPSPENVRRSLRSSGASLGNFSLNEIGGFLNPTGSGINLEAEKSKESLITVNTMLANPTTPKREDEQIKNILRVTSWDDEANATHIKTFNQGSSFPRFS